MTRVFFIDDDNQMNASFAEGLKACGLDVVHMSGEGEFFWKDGEIVALVFGAYNDSSKWQMCQKVRQENPLLPIVYIFPNDCKLEEQISRSVFDCVIRPLTSKKVFFRELQILLDLVQEINQITQQSQTKEVKSLQDISFDTLELGQVIDKILSHFSRMAPCSNVVWIDKSELPGLRGLSDHPFRSEDFRRTVKLRSFHEIKDEDIQKYLTTFRFPQSKKECLLTLKSGPSSNGPHLLVPVFDDQKEVRAHLLFVGVDGIDLDALGEEIQASLSLMARHVRFAFEVWEAENKAFVDDLTDLYNQRYLPQVLDNEVKRSRRLGSPFSVLFIDVDYFKMVNDTRGHWIGSKLLVEISRVIKETIRSTDYAFRYGGDEYVVILVDAAAASGAVVAERIRSNIESKDFNIDGVEVNVTVSIGLAAFPEHAGSSEQLIQLADQAMYYGKNKSRNIVYIAS